MQNPEEDILKRFLQDTFSDYEPMPTEQSWEHIHKAIQPQQPSVGGRIKQWIVPVVALLLLIGGCVWNTNQTSDELEDNSIALLTKPEEIKWSVRTPTTERAIFEGSRPSKGQLPFANDNEFLKKETTVEVIEGNRPSKGRLPFANNVFLREGTTAEDSFVKIQTMAESDNPLKNNELKEESKKLLVNETTSNEEGELPIVTKKQSEVFEKNTSDEIAPNTISTEETQNVLLVSLDEKSSLGMDSKESFVQKSSLVVSVPTDHFENKSFVKNTGTHSQPTAENTPLSMGEGSGVRSYTPINNAIITEVRYTKPIETLKNKDFVVSKPQFEQAKINQINIGKDVKPLRRPTYISLSIMPLQTYRILTVNRRDIQNLQINNLFDAERNGFALELGIVKPIANTWNLRSSVSFLKMRQWAEYQVNTEVVSVKNSISNSNIVAVGSNDNEFIGQTQIENKMLHMVGLKADVQKFLKISGRNRYFISGGTQMMYETNEKQANVFINASAGFQHVVNKNLFLTVEPTASYLLYNINDSKSLIQTNAYNLGLKIGLNFSVK